MRLRLFALLIALAACGPKEGVSLSPAALGDTHVLVEDCVIAGSIRYDAVSDAWSAIADSEHLSRGIKSAKWGEDGTVVVDFTCENPVRVVTFVATPDESYAAENAAMGASVGLSRIVLKFNTQGLDIGDPRFHRANVWLYGIIETERTVTTYR